MSESAGKVRKAVWMSTPMAIVAVVMAWNQIETCKRDEIIKCQEIMLHQQQGELDRRQVWMDETDRILEFVSSGERWTYEDQVRYAQINGHQMIKPNRKQTE